MAKDDPNVEPGKALATLASIGASSAATEDAPIPGVTAGRTTWPILGVLGVGGMGEVLRVHDAKLGRVLALKLIKSERAGHSGTVARFLEEARTTAQLQHPGIVPVHELGQMPDGRWYFTMQEVRGRTLADVIAAVHRASPLDRWANAEGFSFRRLIDAFHAVCEAVAYAHRRGVVHRDLKPENVMLGEFGEVFVVDWGLAKPIGAPPTAPGAMPRFEEDESALISASSRHATRPGAIAGTPAYMAPEQARGEGASVDARSDVYALGAVLFEIVEGRPPFDGATRDDVVSRVVLGPSPRLGQSLRPVPEDLVEICARAMSRDRFDRYPDAQALAHDVAAWLDGERDRERALGIALRAEALGPEAQVLRTRATAFAARAKQALDQLPSWVDDAKRRPAWAIEDEASALFARADRLELEAEGLLHGALAVDPTLPEAHAALALRELARHATAEAERDDRAAARAELLLRDHTARLPVDHPVRARASRWLAGEGLLTLHTDPPGAVVALHRYETVDRRLVPRFVREIGRTPLDAVQLPIGSYLAVLRLQGRPDVRYPVHVRREVHSDGVRPGGASPTPIAIPTHLAEDDVYVPAGWFVSAGDPDALGPAPAFPLWADGFVMKRFPVTLGQFLEFLNDLAAQGRESEALASAPRAGTGAFGVVGDLLVGRTKGGRFELVRDGQGDLWQETWPAIHIDWLGAVAYAAWEASRTGLPWRLASEWEREKAARGVDGRFFPWGDARESAWSATFDGRPCPVPVTAFPIDESPYGVRGLAGNVRDWCLDRFVKESHPSGPIVDVSMAPLSDDPGERRAIRGGTWSNHSSMMRSASIMRNEVGMRSASQGLRLVRSI